MSPYSTRLEGSKIPSVGFGDETSINSFILLTMLNRLNNLKFAWGVMMIFLMTCLPGCKSVTSDENTGIEIAETLTKPITVLSPKSLRRDFASPNSSIFWSVDSFPMKDISKAIKNTKNSQSPLIIQFNNQIFVSFVKILCDLCGKEYRLLKQALPVILNSRSGKDEFKSRRHCGIFFPAEQKQSDYLDQTVRLFRPNSPTIQTKQSDYSDQAARLFRPNTLPV